MKKMLDWLTRFIWVSEFVFLAASTPHIATYFAHFLDKANKDERGANTNEYHNDL